MIAAQQVPLAMGDDGVVRIGGTRVTLDTIVAAFREGFISEEIVSQYPSLRLADVYQVIGYFLDHQAEAAVYLERRQQQAAEVRTENETRFDPAGIRDRLMARRQG